MATSPGRGVDAELGGGVANPAIASFSGMPSVRCRRSSPLPSRLDVDALGPGREARARYSRMILSMRALNVGTSSNAAMFSAR